MSNNTDRNRLRELARRVAEIATEPIQEKKIAEWKRLNALKPGRPLVILLSEGTVWDEIVPLSLLECSDRRCRSIERDCRQ